MLDALHRTVFGPSFDVVMLVYFCLHIPITLFIDAQGLVDKSAFPALFRHAFSNYLSQTCDPIMGARSPVPNWVKPLIACELLFQLPTFFVMVYALWHRKNWIRIPGLIYGVQCATTLLPILGYINLTGLDKKCLQNVATTDQRLFLNLTYGPFFLFPALFAVKCALNETYFPVKNYKAKLAGGRKSR
jgi:hypothetical protein